MHCIILLPDATGRVATVQELRQRGFAISAAVELPDQAGGQAMLLAAEEPAPYGESRPLGL